MESTSASNDVGWTYGEKIDPKDTKRLRCKLCGKEQSGGVSRMKYHIAGIPGNCIACPKATKEDQLICRNAINENKSKKKQKVEKLYTLRSEVNIRGSSETVNRDGMADSVGELKEPKNHGPMDRFAHSEDVGDDNTGPRRRKLSQENIFTKERMVHMKEYICRWTYECGIPFHAFERESFVNLLEAVGQFGPNAKPPTRYEMGETYLRKEVERTRIFLKKNEEEWKLIGCSIMTDAWSDRKRRSIMNLCVNSKKGTVFLSSKECSLEAHTSQNIYEYVESCIVDVGAENVVQVVTDNASNNMGAAKLLKEKRPTIFWTSCATHTINLMLEGIGGISRYNKVIDQAKKLTIFIYAHHKTLALMRQYTKKRDIVRPGVTRFASAYLTLQSIAEKKSQLRHMFNSDDWDQCKLSKTVKGKAAYATVVSPAFWSGVTTCLKVFSPLFKVLRMVDADWKPSMGFLYGELKKEIEEIKVACHNNKKTYDAIMAIIDKKMKGRLDTNLHMAAYILNPFYLYNNPEVQDDVAANDAVVEVVETLYSDNVEMADVILTHEFPKYKAKLEKFGRLLAIKGCEVNHDKYDPANWWSTFGGSAPCLRKIAIRILSLTTSSSGCERNWSTFEGVHTKKRNRLEAAKLNNLVFVQFNANLMERNNKRKARGHEVLLAPDANASKAQEWIVDGIVDEGVDDVEPGLSWDVVNEAMGTDEILRPRRSERVSRELFEDDFESSEDDQVEDEVEYESDGVEILEQYGQNDDGLNDDQE